MKQHRIFADRESAGRSLAVRVAALDLEAPVVLALPRGGVPVAAEVAHALGAPLYLVLVRKIGAPGMAELAAAAVVDGGEAEIVVNEDIARRAGASRAYIQEKAAAELAEIERRRRVYLAHRERVTLTGRNVVLVDDGIATGTTVRAALHAIRRKAPRHVVLAVPVASADAIDDLRPLTDDIICLDVPDDFYALSLSYDDFHQLTDAEVVRILETARTRAARTP
ncbi:MAG: phosphoribosyltransferase family protein [Hyphomicrobiaceae bacterium]|nr:phosphoribosyltransferase family protein [Hyphomicrobiaceae bacterium]